MNKLTDEELVELVQKNSNDADELISRYKKSVSSVVHSYFLTGGDTEDLIQEGLIAVFQAINTFNGKASFKSYALTCVKNRVLSVIKKYNTNKQKVLNNYISLSSVNDGDMDKSEIIVDSGFGPEDKYINEETARELTRKISNVLSDYEYKILNTFLMGFSQREISEKFGKKEKSVDNALQRIKKKILSIVNDN